MSELFAEASCLLSAVVARLDPMGSEPRCEGQSEVVMGQMTLFADGWHLSVSARLFKRRCTRASRAADNTARLSLLFNGDYGPLVTQAATKPDSATESESL